MEKLSAADARQRARNIMENFKFVRSISEINVFIKNVVDLLGSVPNPIQIELWGVPLFSRVEACLKSIKLKDFLNRHKVEKDWKSIWDIISYDPFFNSIDVNANTTYKSIDVIIGNIQTILKELSIVSNWAMDNPHRRFNWDIFGGDLHCHNYFTFTYTGFKFQNNDFFITRFFNSLGKRKYIPEDDSIYYDIICKNSEELGFNQRIAFFRDYYVTNRELKILFQYEENKYYSSDDITTIRSRICQIYNILHTLSDSNFAVGELMFAVLTVLVMVTLLTIENINVCVEVPLLNKCLAITEFCSYNFIKTLDMKNGRSISLDYLELMRQFKIRMTALIERGKFETDLQKKNKRILKLRAYALHLLINRSIFHREDEYYFVEGYNGIKKTGITWVEKCELYPTVESIKEAYNSDVCYICLNELNCNDQIVVSTDCVHLCCLTCFCQWFKKSPEECKSQLLSDAEIKNRSRYVHDKSRMSLSVYI